MDTVYGQLRGAGICRLQITVAVSGLDKTVRTYPWRIRIQDKNIWQCHEAEQLICNSEGIGVGTVALGIANFLRALAPDLNVGQILSRVEAAIESGKDPSGVLAGYINWKAEVVTDPGAIAELCARWEWPDTQIGLTFDIDMSISGRP